MDKAKVFWSGRSQAVRLPRSFRFEESEVRIRRSGNAVILEPIPTDWAWLDALSESMKQGFSVKSEKQAPAQDRPELEEAFN